MARAYFTMPQTALRFDLSAPFLLVSFIFVRGHSPFYAVTLKFYPLKLRYVNGLAEFCGSFRQLLGATPKSWFYPIKTGIRTTSAIAISRLATRRFADDEAETLRRLAGFRRGPRGSTAMNGEAMSHRL